MRPPRSGISAGAIAVSAIISVLACGPAVSQSTAPASAGATSAPSAAASAAARRVTVTLNWVLDYEQPLYFAALEKGFYADAGLDVTVMPGTGSGNTVKTVGSGVGDIGVADAVSVIQGIDKGLDLTVVGALFQQNPMAVMSRADANIKTPGDLRGKKIGAILGGSPYVLLLGLLASQGIDQSELEIVGLSSVGIAELSAGQIDGMASFWPNVGLYEGAGVDVEVLKGQDYGQDAYGLSFFVRTEWLEDPANQAAMKAFLASTLQGLEYSVANPQESLEFEEKYNPSLFGSGKEAVVAAYELQTELYEKRDANQGQFYITADTWQATVDLLVTSKVIGEPADPASMYTNDYQ